MRTCFEPPAMRELIVRSACDSSSPGRYSASCGMAMT